MFGLPIGPKEIMDLVAAAKRSTEAMERIATALETRNERDESTPSG